MANPLVEILKVAGKVKSANKAKLALNELKRFFTGEAAAEKQLNKLAKQKILQQKSRWKPTQKQREANLEKKKQAIRDAKAMRSAASQAELKWMQENADKATKVYKSGTREFGGDANKLALLKARQEAMKPFISQKASKIRKKRLKSTLAGIAGIAMPPLLEQTAIQFLPDDVNEHYTYPGLAWLKDIVHHNTIGLLPRNGIGKDFDALNLILDEDNLSPEAIKYLKEEASKYNPEVGDTINFTTEYGKMPYSLEKTIGYGTFGVTKDKNGKRRITVPKNQKYNDSYDWANFGSYEDATYRDAEANNGKARGFFGNLYDAFKSNDENVKNNAKTRITDYMQTIGSMLGSRGGTTNHGGSGEIPDGYEVIVVSPDYKGEVFIDSKGRRHPKRWTPKQENGTTHWKVNIPID